MSFLDLSAEPAAIDFGIEAPSAERRDILDRSCIAGHPPNLQPVRAARIHEATL